jgi:hypothetical protein
MGENAPKIVIVVLVVVVVLFVVGIGVGAGGGVSSISVDAVINSLGGLFPAPAVSVDEITASPSGCFDGSLQRIIIPGGGECALEFAESSANVRSLKLQIAPGGLVHLEMVVSPAEDQEMTITTDLPNNGDRQISLTLFPSGGSLFIDECVVNSGSACIIDLVS